MSVIVTLSFPGHVTPSNNTLLRGVHAGRGGYGRNPGAWKYHESFRLWGALVFAEALRVGAPRGLTGVRIKLVSNRSRLLDLDNLLGGAKPLIDALGEPVYNAQGRAIRNKHGCGVIVDDGPGHVVGYTCEQNKVARRDIGTFLIITG